MPAAAPVAHVTSYPHQEYPPTQPKSNGGGASPVLVIVGIVVTLALVAALIRVRERLRVSDDEPDAG